MTTISPTSFSVSRYIIFIIQHNINDIIEVVDVVDRNDRYVKFASYIYKIKMM